MKIDKRLLRQLPGIRGYVIVTVLIGTLLGMLVIIQAYTLSHIISRVFLSARTLSQVWGLMLIFLGVILVRACFAWSREVAAGHIAGRIKTHLRERLLSHLFSLGPGYTRGERSGELVSTIVEGVEALDPYFSQYLPQYFLSILVPQAGKIKERGKHHDLLQAEGLYWKLWQLQNQVIDSSCLT